MNCGEVRDIAAHGLCFRCYRAKERAEKSAPDPLWARQGNGWLLKEQKKALTVVTNILKNITDCPFIDEDDRKQIKSILRPYLDKMAECFAPTESNRPVNGERKFESSPSAESPRGMSEHIREHARCSLTEGKICDDLPNQIQSGEEQ